MKSQQGVSLVEALVALVVLSVGLLGIAGLFVESLRNNRTALLRTQAINFTSDMGDRIRANATAGDAYDMDTYGGAPSLHACSPTIDVAGGNCTIAELAEDDLARWQTAVTDALPAPQDATPQTDVQFVATPGRPDRYRITIAWQEPAEVQPYTYTSEIVVMPRPPIT
jgi:type IV pilus assembly protein PilV